MDPLTAVGLLANIAQAVSLAKGVVSEMYKYFAAVRDAPQRSLELRRELCVLCDLLEALEPAITQVSTGEQQSSSFETVRQSLSGELTEMLQYMKLRVSDSKLSRLERLKWPFSKEENERLVARIERYKATLTLAMEIKAT
jgi:hypothetical protein